MSLDAWALDARQKENRGDVILQVSESAWAGYFQRQTFMNAFLATGVLFPTIVVVPDGWIYDAFRMQAALRKDPAYQRPGLLITRLERTGENECTVHEIAFLSPTAGGQDDRR